MAADRYNLQRAITMRCFGIEDVDEFQRLLTTADPVASGAQQMYDQFIRSSARIYSAAHPKGFHWVHDVATITTSVLSTYTVDSTFNSNKPAEFDSFHDMKARVSSSGSWKDVRRVEWDYAVERNLINRSSMPATVRTPTMYAIHTVGGAVKLELFPDTIIDGNDIDLYIPYVRTIPAIDGTSSPDGSMLWDTEDDDPIFTLATMMVARLRRDWNQFEGSMRLAYMQTRERLAKLGIYELGAGFTEIMKAIQDAERPG